MLLFCACVRDCVGVYVLVLIRVFYVAILLAPFPLLQLRGHVSFMAVLDAHDVFPYAYILDICVFLVHVCACVCGYVLAYALHRIPM